MQIWWTELTVLNQVFYGIAVFFSFLFLWQLITTLTGLGDSVDGFGATDAGPDVDGFDAGVATFQLLSIRSVIAFGMLFGWAAALYLDSGHSVEQAVISGVVWGAAGMVIVAYFFFKVQQLSESHTRNLSSCIGNEGEVYIDIPENGTGQIRVLESGAVNYVSARSKGGQSIAHKTQVRVLRTLNTTTVEVEPI